jgi:hypothetical protein
VVQIVIPPYFVRTIFDDQLQTTRPDTVRTVTQQARIRMFDYGRPTNTLAESNGLFTIEQ